MTFKTVFGLKQMVTYKGREFKIIQVSLEVEPNRKDVMYQLENPLTRAWASEKDLLEENLPV
jgi:hypothetical protein